MQSDESPFLNPYQLSPNLVQMKIEWDDFCKTARRGDFVRDYLNLENSKSSFNNLIYIYGSFEKKTLAFFTWNTWYFHRILDSTDYVMYCIL